MHPDRVRPVARAVASLAALLLVVACGGGGGNSGDLPVEEQLGLEQAGILQRQGKAENLIRDCMKAQGFDYVPADPQAQQAALVGQPGLSEDDFNTQYGYGITTLYEQRQQLATGPNQAARTALGAADRAAYDQALLGDDKSATFAEALDTGDYSRLGGCTKQATEAVFGGVEVFQGLQEKLDELDQAVVADPRMVKAIAAWSECMRAEGYDMTDPQQVDGTLLSELEAIVGPPDDPKPDYDQAALAALQSKEVAMVGSDLKCENDHITAVEEKVRAEYEATFREQNADLLTKVPPP